ncbi:hypothetical protein Tco_0958037, partial [Tanacetum coccineum]
TPSDIQHSVATQIWGCYRLVSRAKVIENQGADDEEISEGGIPRVIVLGYDGLPMQPVAPPSPDYIPGPEDPHTPPVPQDEDEREPMFVHAHDPDYVSEPIYPEYIPLEDDHEFPTEEQPLPPVDSPTAESPGYVTESDPEEDPEEYEDDETKDDDADDEDDEDAEEEEHLAPVDSAIVVPVDEPVFSSEGTEPVIPPPSTDITIGAIYQTWVGPAEAVPEIAHMTIGERVDTRVTELVELHEHDTQDLYALLEDAQDRDSIDGGGGGLCFPRGLGSLDRIESGDPSGASDLL